MKTVPRIGVMLVGRSGVSRDEIRSALIEMAEAACSRLSPGGEARAGVRSAEDPFSAFMGDRSQAEIVDAVLEISLDGDAAMLLEAARDIKEHVRRIADTAASTAVGGLAHLVVGGTGPLMMAFVGRHHPAVTPQTFSRWWLGQHGPLVRSIVGDRFLGYQQVHPDAAFTTAACEVLGFGPPRYHVFESVFFARLADFLEPMMEPSNARRIFEDEVGFADHDTPFFGAFTDVVVHKRV